MANMCIVDIYQYWEEHYRKSISDALGVGKNDIKSNILGDLRYLRQSILHHRGICITKKEKFKILKFFDKDEPIKITSRMMDKIITIIRENLFHI